MVRQAHHDRGKTVRPESFDSPFALSLSKGERFAQDRLVEGCPDRPLRLAVRPEVLEG